jgi:hypothetical protein
MKRNAEFLVTKRDGRHEWLRASKLARSIERALVATNAGESWQAIEIAETVIAGLRRRWACEGCGSGDEGRAVLSTDLIARTVERVLYATGFAGAAVHYAETRGERARRRRILGARVAADLLVSNLPCDRSFDRN